MFEKEDDKYKVIYVFYVRASSSKEAVSKTDTLKTDDADEKTVVKLRK